MAKQIDIQKEAKKIWEGTKKNLLKFGQETVKLAKRGEKEIIRASQFSRLHLDILGMKRKREILYQQIGAKVVALETEGKEDLSSVKSLCSQVHSLNSQIKEKEHEASKIKKTAKRKK